MFMKNSKKCLENIELNIEHFKKMGGRLYRIYHTPDDVSSLVLCLPNTRFFTKIVRRSLQS